jgi:hypothetical protein
MRQRLHRKRSHSTTRPTAANFCLVLTFEPLKSGHPPEQVGWKST